MIQKKYNAKRVNDETTSYLSVKGKRYDRDYTLSILPVEAKRGFESYSMFTGVTLRLDTPARWSTKKEQAMDMLVDTYSDKLAELFLIDEELQRNSVEPGKHYVYRLVEGELKKLLIEVFNASSSI